MSGERPSRVAGAVVWSGTAAPGERRVLPDGCMDLIWMDDALLIAGADTRAHVVPDDSGSDAVGIRFPPGVGPAVFGVPAHELRDERVPLCALWGEATVRRLTEALVAAPDRGHALEAIGRQRLRTVTPDPLYMFVATRLDAGHGVTEVARAAGLSVRQLHRRSLRGFGYGPKTLARVLRMQRALASARAGLSLTDVAARAGYADQSHLCLEVKALAGLPLGELLAGSGR